MRKIHPWTSAGALATGVLLLAGAGCGSAGDADDAATAETASAPLPDTVEIQEPGLHPEGIEWDADGGRFLVSSVTRGTVTEVHDDGTHRTFIQDTAITASIGIHVDGASGRLLVANSDLSAVQDSTAEGQAKLGAYDLATGERVYMTDLGSLADGRHFANDMTSGPDGVAYVTDSFSPVIYRVGPDGEASVFVEDDRLGGQGFGLNGIDYHADGYLVVAMAGDQTFYKVPLDDPSSMTEVSVPEPIGADGIVFRSPTELAVVGSGEVLLLKSQDGWESATIAGRFAAPLAPTTAAVRDGAVYAVTPHFEGMGGEEPVEVFEIFRIEFGQGAGG